MIPAIIKQQKIHDNLEFNNQPFIISGISDLERKTIVLSAVPITPGKITKDTRDKINYFYKNQRLGYKVEVYFP